MDTDEIIMGIGAIKFLKYRGVCLDCLDMDDVYCIVEQLIAMEFIK